MHDIFLSYSTDDRERLVPLVAALEQQGWSVFWDHRSVPIGEKWREVIEEAVCQCRCVIVVWSQASVKSKWVKEEASEGSRRDVLLPIRVDDVLPPFGFREDQAGNFIGWNGTADYSEFTRLTDRIRSLLEEQAKREAVEAAERERLAKERTAADQKARDDAERQRWLDESQARLAAEEATKQKKLAQERAAEQKAREEAEQQAIARADQLKREQAAAEEKARKEAARQTKINQYPPDKKFPLIPALLLTTAVLGVGGYYWKSSVGASLAGDSSAQQESLAGQAPTAVPVAALPPPEPTPAEQLQQVETWLQSDDKTQWAEAVKQLEKLSNADNVDAKFILGGLYYLGKKGVKANPTEGCKLYKEAAAKSHKQAEKIINDKTCE
jgi:hypothetical protein